MLNFWLKTAIRIKNREPEISNGMKKREEKKIGEVRFIEFSNIFLLLCSFSIFFSISPRNLNCVDETQNKRLKRNHFNACAFYIYTECVYQSWDKKSFPNQWKYIQRAIAACVSGNVLVCLHVPIYLFCSQCQSFEWSIDKFKCHFHHTNKCLPLQIDPTHPMQTMCLAIQRMSGHTKISNWGHQSVLFQR